MAILKLTFSVKNVLTLFIKLEFDWLRLAKRHDRFAD
jgi:hypothetical protein